MSYDPSAPGRHEYLPECTEVGEAHMSVLHQEQKYELPAIWLQKQIHPGLNMPIMLNRCYETTRQAIAKSLSSPRPYTGYVACGYDPDGSDRNLGHTHMCVAFVSQRTVATHSIVTPSGFKPVPQTVLLKGTSRARCMSYALLPEGLMSKRAASAVVCIERDRSCCAMPKEFHTVLGSAMFWGAAEARMFDVPTVLSRVLVLYQQVVPTVQVPSIVDDERMSFWLLESLPLSCERQHELFCMSTLHRLKEIRSLLEEWQQRAQFSCCTCGSQIGMLRDSISDVSDLGPSGTFVNAHGCMHSITCVSRVTTGSVACVGMTTPEFSWFPSYSWTTAICLCGEHVGWRFTRVSGNGPDEFWGLTHSALSVSQPGGDMNQVEPVQHQVDTELFQRATYTA